MNPDTAAHEARHASAAMLLGLPVVRASAVPQGDCLGHVKLAGVDCDRLREHALMIMAGPLGEPGWPPDRPPAGEQKSEDERQLGALAELLELDQSGWHRLAADALNLAAEPAFERLEFALTTLLERGYGLDKNILNQVKTIAGEAGMEHINLKAALSAVSTTDLGVFEAVISTESVDREKDIVSATAMVAALRKWNRPIPLTWNHSSKAEDIFGSIDPQSVHAQGGEVMAQGRVDLDSTVGREAWRGFKAGTIGFSFAYMVGSATARPGGGRHITELDVFEVTATSTPMNNSTRVLGTKSTNSENSVGSKARDLRLERLLRVEEPAPVKAAEPERKSTAPITIASFEC